MKKVFLFMFIGLGCIVHQSKSQELKDMEITLVPFQEFNPQGSNEEKVAVRDTFLNLYLRHDYTLNDLVRISLGLLESKNEQREISIKNYEKFEEGIISLANSFGYSPEELKHLSIHDAVLLSGKITAHKMEYYKKMVIDEKEIIREAIMDVISKDSSRREISNEMKEALVEELSQDPVFCFNALQLDILKGKDRRSEEAKKIDQSQEDEIFYNGLGVCRNYTTVNIAVFEVLKRMNPILWNTYMKWHSPDERAEMVVLRHAWNQVVTLTQEGEKMKVLMTFVDPTWLDIIRSRTVANTGEQVKADYEEIYNALDEHHFFTGSLSSHVHVAKLYEFLSGGDRRKAQKQLYNDLDTISQLCLFYRKKAFQRRLDVCRAAVEVAQEKSDSVRGAEFGYFKESFLEAMVNMIGKDVGIVKLFGFSASFLENGWNEYYNPRDEKQLKKLKNVFEEASHVFSLDKEKVTYYVYEKKEDGTQEAIEKEIGFPELLREVEKRFYEE